MGGASGCATIFSGSTRQIHVTSAPPGADIFIQNVPAGKTPSTVDVSTQKPIIKVKKTYYESQEKVLHETINPVVCIDCLVWPTVIVDLMMGSAFNLQPDDVNFILSLSPKYAVIANISDQNILAQFALMDGKEIDERLFSITKLTNNALLARVAVESINTNVSQMALDKIIDQVQLGKVADESRNWHLRKIALNRLIDPEVLQQLKKNAHDAAVRVFLQVSLGERTWVDVVAQAERDTDFLPIAMAAVALANQQDALSSQVTALCHRYIRLGEEARIPELTELLNQYGDKLLAEDYLNCGKSELNAAGRAWAEAHGLSVSTGQGSNRASWGRR